jgi:hypothetical protein
MHIVRALRLALLHLTAPIINLQNQVLVIYRLTFNMDPLPVPIIHQMKLATIFLFLSKTNRLLSKISVFNPDLIQNIQ